MDLAQLRAALSEGRVEWKRHTVQRMIERGIHRSDVLLTLQSGEVIEEYPTDTPYPSALFLAVGAAGPLHVVASLDPDTRVAHIITVYRPDADHFLGDFRARRQP